MLVKKNKAIQEASEHLHILTENKRIHLQREGREMYERDMAIMHSEGRNEGISLKQKRIAQLYERLLDDGRLDYMRRSTKILRTRNS